MVFVALAIATLCSASAVFSASTPNPPVRLCDLVKRGGTVTGPVIPTDFADPGLILPNGQPPCSIAEVTNKHKDSTSSSHSKVPYAISEDFTSWTPVQGDALPNPGSWVSSSNSAVWAPDVRQITSTSYVMYYMAFSAANGNHCIGAATSSTPAIHTAIESHPLRCVWRRCHRRFGIRGPRRSSLPRLEGGRQQHWQIHTHLYPASYAIAKSATGPYTKVQAPNAPLLVSGKCGTAGPGGATVINVLAISTAKTLQAVGQHQENVIRLARDGKRWQELADLAHVARMAAHRQIRQNYKSDHLP
ncbi:Arabinanase/levansucrase/invertase [Mycena albidolilacea]|uniref:Arabinanase/levansucrase/invertase n=1 Tax=Mycena albidolilacea TaxID=1033008 RepID=A0AAD7ELT0_9AGAR|nr:Arabinanase/levansucrase/invertase [Mycena albidolilacea]